MGQPAARLGNSVAQVSFTSSSSTESSCWPELLEYFLWKLSFLFSLQFFSSMAVLIVVWITLLSLLQMVHCSVSYRHTPGKPQLLISYKDTAFTNRNFVLHSETENPGKQISFYNTVVLVLPCKIWGEISLILVCVELVLAYTSSTPHSVDYELLEEQTQVQTIERRVRHTW